MAKRGGKTAIQVRAEVLFAAWLKGATRCENPPDIDTIWAAYDASVERAEREVEAEAK